MVGPEGRQGHSAPRCDGGKAYAAGSDFLGSQHWPARSARHLASWEIDTETYKSNKKETIR